MNQLSSYITRVKSAAWFAAVLFMLTACGFHLRGALELPVELNNVYISAKSSTVLVEDIKTILETNGATVLNDATAASATIKIDKEKNSERVLSVDSDGRGREYELQYTVSFSVTSTVDAETSRVVIDNKKLELVRDYVYDSSAVLGKSREKGVLIRDMQRDASRLIMLQIQAAYRKQADAEQSPAQKTEKKTEQNSEALK